MEDITDFNFWNHLVEEMEHLMKTGESLINKLLALAQKYQISLESEIDWEKLPGTFRDELRLNIISLISDMSNIDLPNVVLQNDIMYWCIFEKLEAQYFRLDKKDASARTLLLNLMHEVMSGSIESKTMQLSTWHDFLEKRKESSRVENVGEYVYKNVCATFESKEVMNIYDFFYNKTSTDEIDRLLCEAKESLLLAYTYRGKTKKRGQGMSRFIIDYVHYWQDLELMKPLKTIYPFCQCLQKYWKNEINLGTRQGLEATYKQRVKTLPVFTMK